MRPILVTGFGPFLEVLDNPSGALATAIDGAVVAGVPIVGRRVDVSYSRGPAATVALAHQLDARLVLGLGVARTRSVVCVEAVGRRLWGEHPDVDGCSEPMLQGPPVVPSTLDVDVLAALLGGRRSEDAGRYVCNGWLYQVAQALVVPVGFVHIPPQGLASELLLQALEQYLAMSRSDCEVD